MKTGIVSSSLLLLTVIGLTACGPLKQDPAADYKKVDRSAELPAKTAGTDAKFEGLAQIEIDDVLNFTEGEASSYVITPRVLLGGVSYVLTMTGAPIGARLSQRVSGQPDQGYNFSWTPVVGTTVESSSFEVVFKIVITTANARSKSALEGAKLTEAAKVSVRKTDKLPTVDQIKKASDTITEGDVVAVTITVADPGAFGNEVPVLSITDVRSRNKDYKFVAGAKAVIAPEAPVALGGGKYRFDLKLDSKNLAMPSKGDSADVKFLVSVTSPSGNSSASEEVNLKMNRKPAPVVAPTAPTAQTAPNGAKP